ncbi:hypothetical protein JTB14_003530 [Gonioctena quinquepunctata]|nr:hypothetical protein JTB14_003530 [Gonioctena quinquepunctata]
MDLKRRKGTKGWEKQRKMEVWPHLTRAGIKSKGKWPRAIGKRKRTNFLKAFGEQTEKGNLGGREKGGKELNFKGILGFLFGGGTGLEWKGKIKRGKGNLEKNGENLDAGPIREKTHGYLKRFKTFEKEKGGGPWGNFTVLLLGQKFSSLNNFKNF